jgi:hypothetical protein
MNATAPRHGALSDFLALTDALSVRQIAEALRCCTRSVRNWMAGRSPIPWHRIEMLRLRAAEVRAAQAAMQAALEDVPVVPTLAPDPDAPDVTPAEILAWVGVFAPHFLSSQHRFASYVRMWNVADKIRRAKAEGDFAAVLSKWRAFAADLRELSSWRAAGAHFDTGPPAYRRRE